MSGGNRTIVAGALALLATGCMETGSGGKLAIKALPSPLAQGDRPVSFRVAEAAGQFRLGNVALSLESYRKALRDEPQSVDALVGMAACYDSMGRFDMSRRNYEAALANAPADTRVLAQFAGSLAQQGRSEEASAVRREIATRVAAAAPPMAPTAPAPSGPVAMQVAASSVTVALPVARPEIAIVPLPPARPVTPPAPEPRVEPQMPAPRAGREETSIAVIDRPLAGPRLERLSLGEVALVTKPEPVRFGEVLRRAAPPSAAPKKVQVASTPSPARPAPIAAVSPPVRAALAVIPAAAPVQVGRPNSPAPAQYATVRVAAPRFRPTRRPTIASATSQGSPDGPGQPLLLLNAARSEGLARRARVYLASRGFGSARIGDAPRVRARTIIIYPQADRARALRLAKAFAIPALAVAGKRLTILLGRDAAAQRVLRS